jgi:histidinol-phosphate aminotransferase
MIPPRPELSRLAPYTPGKSMDEIRETYGLHKIVKLASNENPLGPPVASREAFVHTASQLSLYPRGDAPELTRALAQKYGVSTSQVVVGNGSDEILDMICRAYLEPGSTACGARSTFSVYRSAAELAGARYEGAELGSQGAYPLPFFAGNAKIIFLCNPNNPTGYCHAPDEITRFLESVPESTLVVLDQAYAEYTPWPNWIPSSEKFPNVLTTRTFSKIYGLAGLRVGYALASAEVARELLKVKPPFNVNLPAQAAALAALGDTQHFVGSVETNLKGKLYWQEKLDDWKLETLPSEANFLCVRLGEKAKEIVLALESQGLIIRHLASFGMEEHVRITIGTERENAFAIDLMQKILKAKGVI